MSVPLEDVVELLDSKLGKNDMLSLIESLSGMCTDDEFSKELVSKYPVIIFKSLKCHDAGTDLMSASLDFVINISSHPSFMCNINNFKDDNSLKFSEFVSHIFDIIGKSTDVVTRCKAAQLLSNLSREDCQMYNFSVKNNFPVEIIFKIALTCDSDIPHVLRDDAIMVILNFSQELSCQKYLIENLTFLEGLMNIFQTSPSEKWKISCIGILKNILKTSEFHVELVEKTDLLGVLLHLLVGFNNYTQDISKHFPHSVEQFIGKPIDISVELRSSILEALYLLSATRHGREKMRSTNVYDVLKNIAELDLTDGESDNCLDCIGLLIRTEDEIGFDDLLTLQIPKDVQDKINK